MGGLANSNVSLFEVDGGSVRGQNSVGGLIGQNITNVVEGSSSI